MTRRRREPRIEGNVILTASGRYVNPLALRPEDVAIEDIWHALSQQCRYSGHTRVFYSVAEHSVRCADYVESVGCSADVVLATLLHDASEAYLIDLPRPLKDEGEMGRLYLEAEARAQAAIAEAFGTLYPYPPDVKAADMILLATERRDLMPSNGEWVILDGIEPLPERIHPWPPLRAATLFALRFERLTRQAQEAA